MSTPAGQAAPGLVIRGAAVVDTRDGSVEPGQEVHIAGERILGVSPAGTYGIPAGANVLEADGKYLVPGFNDMHAHMHSRPAGSRDQPGTFDLMLAHGITGFRQMSGSARMLKARAAGTLMPAGRAPAARPARADPDPAQCRHGGRGGCHHPRSARSRRRLHQGRDGDP